LPSKSNRDYRKLDETGDSQGWLFDHVMHLDPFQATVLSLAGMLAFGFLASSIFQTIMNTISPPPANEDDDEDKTEFDVEEVDEEPVIHPGISHWRQPLKTPDFSNTRPDDRCPCGSGRKYKNCHGAPLPRTQVPGKKPNGKPR